MNCYKCGKPYLKTPCCPDCGIIPIAEPSFNHLKKENEIMKEALTFIADQKKSLPGHWAVVLAQKTLNELGE